MCVLLTAWFRKSERDPNTNCIHRKCRATHLTNRKTLFSPIFVALCSEHRVSLLEFLVVQNPITVAGNNQVAFQNYIFGNSPSSSKMSTQPSPANLQLAMQNNAESEKVSFLALHIIAVSYSLSLIILHILSKSSKPAYVAWTSWIIYIYIYIAGAKIKCDVVS